MHRPGPAHQAPVAQQGSSDAPPPGGGPGGGLEEVALLHQQFKAERAAIAAADDQQLHETHLAWLDAIRENAREFAEVMQRRGVLPDVKCHRLSRGEPCPLAWVVAVDQLPNKRWHERLAGWHPLDVAVLPDGTAHNITKHWWRTRWTLTPLGSNTYIGEASPDRVRSSFAAALSQHLP